MYPYPYSQSPICRFKTRWPSTTCDRTVAVRGEPPKGRSHPFIAHRCGRIAFAFAFSSNSQPGIEISLIMYKHPACPLAQAARLLHHNSPLYDFHTVHLQFHTPHTPTHTVTVVSKLHTLSTYETLTRLSVQIPAPDHSGPSTIIPPPVPL
jgi:hypothetical protein